MFVTGRPGIGKSMIITKTLANLREHGNIMPININMSALTSSARTQQSIEEKLEKKKRTLYGAQPGKKIAIFVDDINMPRVEQLGAQPPIELLRLLLDKKGLYQREEWTSIDVKDMTIITCAAPLAGGRAELTPRFLGRFNILRLPDVSNGTISTIFSTVLRGFQNMVNEQLELSIASTIEIYTRI